MIHGSASEMNPGDPDAKTEDAGELTHKILSGQYGGRRFLPRYRNVDLDASTQMNSDLGPGWSTWVKPVPVMLGFGIPGLLLFFGSPWLGDLVRLCGGELGEYGGLWRVLMMLFGAVFIGVAWPLRVPQDQRTGKASLPDGPAIPPPLKTKR